MSMIGSTAQIRLCCLLVPMWLIASTVSVPAAGSEAEFKAAFAAAEAAEKEAEGLRNRWTATEAALTEANKAADRGDFDQAISQAKEAEALAKASIFQDTNEKDAWKNLEIR